MNTDMTEKIKKINVDNTSAEKQPYIPPTQSADTLFHFVDKKEFLFSTILNFAMTPRYCIEDVEYLDIGMKKIAYPMLCFCDINLHKMQEHISVYGDYGIAFSKRWGIAKGIQPIHYLNPYSFLKEDFAEAFFAAMRSDTNDAAQNYLLSQMYYFKAIEGTMERAGETTLKNFTDEREWRYIPDVKELNMPQVVTESDIFHILELNETLSSKDTCWLKFHPSDIKYIILKSDDDFGHLVDIIKEENLEESVVNKLISRILVWENTKGDF